MTAPISFTFDLEDHRPSPTWEARYPAYARQMLDFLDEQEIRATVFVVGRIAERSPELVREIAERGHEIGLHNYEHWALFSCVPSTFSERTTRARGLLQDLSGQEVTGFRSPAGTLMPTTYWATEMLTEVGFMYSASVLPVQTYGVGFPGCPTEPFRWPSGLLEAPCPSAGVGHVGLAFMGGTFLRVLPMPLVLAGHRRLSPDSAPWVYSHPYDIDTLEKFWVVSDVKWYGSLLLWLNRGLMLRKLERLMDGRRGEPLGERLAALDAAGKISDWSPDDSTLNALATGGSHGRLGGRVAQVLRREQTRKELSPPEHLLARELEPATAAAG